MKKHSILISFIALIFNIGFCSANEDATEKDSDYVYTFVEKMPEFPGGLQKMTRFILENFIYPRSLVEMGLQGKTICKFIVEKDGSLSNITILRSLHPDIDKELIRVVELMPKWIAGEKNGETVRVYFAFPFDIRLQMN